MDRARCAQAIHGPEVIRLICRWVGVVGRIAAELVQRVRLSFRSSSSWRRVLTWLTFRGLE